MKFFKNGLITESGSRGDKYLRLYGVLNAYYLQLGVITNLARLLILKDMISSQQTLLNLEIS